MQISFSKYQGTGNDFILIDNRQSNIGLTTAQVAHLCHRRFGIGADGLMLLELEEGYDFKMVYYNSDGKESTMCGNGGRCITAFAKQLGIMQNEALFLAVDGPHKAAIDEQGIVALHMQDVNGIVVKNGDYEMNTGSPHYVQFVADVAGADVFNEGRTIRNSDVYQPKGINVNFVQQMADGIWVRTYERGVEDETYSCGTGVTAAAIASVKDASGTFDIAIKTPGGPLKVSFAKADATSASNVVLTGPAVYVYGGEVTVL